jgi:hypothetical protein
MQIGARDSVEKGVCVGNIAMSGKNTNVIVV